MPKPGRRSVVIFLHWSCVLLILAMVEGGTAHPAVLWCFVGAVAAWLVVTAARGMLGRAGPKLSPGFRRAYPWMHRALFILLGLTALAVLLRLLGRPLAWLDAWTLLLVTLAAGGFHALFHLWRHMALYDGALRRMTPRAMHRWL